MLEGTFRGLREETGARSVTPVNRRQAERILLDTMEPQRRFRLSPNQTRLRTAVRRLEFDLLRYLRREADRDGSFEPAYLELRFGMADSDQAAVELAGGARVRGKIDRVDRWNGWELVTDYKSGPTSTRSAGWQPERRIQAALYMLVAAQALDLEPAGGVYVPLRGTERRRARDRGRGGGRRRWAAGTWTTTGCRTPRSAS